jgi:hypothetical protein
MQTAKNIHFSSFQRGVAGVSASMVKDEGFVFAELVRVLWGVWGEVMLLYPVLVWMWICSLRGSSLC